MLTLFNEHLQHSSISIHRCLLVSLQKFKLKVEGLGNFIWKATEKELTKLKGYLYSQTETAQMITQLGWQRKGFFAFGNGIFFDGQWMKTDDFGIVHLGEKGNFYLPASSKIYRDETKMYDFERRFVHLNLSSVTLREFTDQFFLVFGNNARIGFSAFLCPIAIAHCGPFLIICGSSCNTSLIIRIHIIGRTVFHIFIAKVHLFGDIHPSHGNLLSSAGVARLSTLITSLFTAPPHLIA